MWMAALPADASCERRSRLPSIATTSPWVKALHRSHPLHEIALELLYRHPIVGATNRRTNGNDHNVNEFVLSVLTLSWIR
jgi:hypothetical protein